MKSMQPFQVSSPFDGTQLCSMYDTDIFYPEEYTEESVAKAKSICGDCWLNTKCLSYAVANRENEGVWGGTTPRERRLMLRRKKK